jgi:glycosyltransferase involved in cell wall biosynthesis
MRRRASGSSLPSVASDSWPDTMSKAPRVSIGLPVYNAADTVARAIDSLLAQTVQDFELLVSDNASTDDTPAILAGYARRDGRVRVVRQSTNIGPLANFAYVLRHAAAPYFMWAAADDCWAPTFVERNLEFLEANADYVTSMSKARLEPPLPPSRAGFDGTFALTATPAENMRRFIASGCANVRFYGLHRRAALLQAWSDEEYWAADLAFTMRLLQFGKQHEVDEALFTYDTRGMGSLPYFGVRRLGLGLVDTWMPYLRFSIEVLRLPQVRRSPSVWLTLAYRNLRLSAHMVRFQLRQLLRPG